MDDDNHVTSESHEHQTEIETPVNDDQNTETRKSTDQKNVMDVIGNGQLVKTVRSLLSFQSIFINFFCGKVSLWDR